MRKKYDGQEIVKAVLFIKSEKEFNEIVDTAMYLKKKCARRGLYVDYCFLDDTTITDISREAMEHFLERVYCENFELIIVRSLKEISNNAVEREAFLLTMQANGIGVYILEEGCFATVNYDYGC